MPSEPRSRRDRHAVQAAHGESPVQLVLTPEKLDALYAVSTRAQQPCFVEVDVLLLIDRAEKSARLCAVEGGLHGHDIISRRKDAPRGQVQVRKRSNPALEDFAAFGLDCTVKRKRKDLDAAMRRAGCERAVHVVPG